METGLFLSLGSGIKERIFSHNQPSRRVLGFSSGEGEGNRMPRWVIIEEIA